VDLAGRRATNVLLLEAVALGQRVGGREDGRRVGGATRHFLFLFLRRPPRGVGRGTMVVRWATLGSRLGVELPCGRSLVRKRPSAGVSITPMELG
jgi:hypothetical protein